MKKLVAIMLILVLALSLFAGCGNDKPTTEQTNTPASNGEWVPTKDINYIVPYAAGGNSDVAARIITKYMSKYAPVKIEVSNITGAGGRTGALEVQKAKPDGYTILHQPVAYPMQASLGIANFTYEDFEPISLWLDSCLAIVVKADAPYNNLEEFIAAAKAEPRKIKAGALTGTLPLFAIIDLQNKEDIEFNIVDLKQKAPELLGGRIDMYIDGFGAVKQYIDGKQFKCLGLISNHKMVGYDEIPCYEDLGYDNYEFLKQCHGVWAPKGTPQNAVEYLDELFKKACEDPECICEIQKLGYGLGYLKTADYIEYLKNTYDSFNNIAKSLIG